MKPLLAIRRIAACVVLLAVSLARGQGTRADYARADSISQRTADRVSDASVDPHWADDGNSFWYATDHGRSVWVVDAVAGTRRAATDAERATFHVGRLPDLGAPRASGEPGEPTSITFVNRTGAAARFFWIDAGGRPVPYGEVPPGGRVSQHTYAGHVWLVRDAAGATLGVFAAAVGDAQAVLGADDDAATRPTSEPTTRASTRPHDSSGDGRPFVGGRHWRSRRAIG